VCGISGVIVKKNPDYVTKVYHKLLLASQIRGQDGTGITRLRNGEFLTKKWDKKVSDIQNTNDYKEILDFKVGDRVIGQNRYATFGLDHSNDQPLVTDVYALVHNGVLYDYEKQYDKFENFYKHSFKRDYKVDTELILRLIELQPFLRHSPKYIEDILYKIEGEAACLLLINNTIQPFLVAFMKNKVLYKGEDEFGNIYFFSTLYIKNKVSQICKNIYEFKNYDVFKC